MTDTFPKHGRVTEVCKEWRVHEDNALAHHLQSQEINEHYKGNRYRNQTVREDFPTALSEQNKEKENAERQAALYHQMINEQEEADARVARELAEKMKAEIEIERRRQAEENEKMARKLQKELFVDKRYGMQQPNDLIPPTVYPKKSNIQHCSPTVVEKDPAPVSPTTTPTSSPSSRLNYVSLDLSNPPAKMVQQRSPSSRTQYTQVMPQQQPNYDLSSYSNSSEQHHHYDHINLQSHTPDKKQAPHFNQSRQQISPTKSSGHTSPPLYVNAEPIERHPNRTTSPDHYENSVVLGHQHGHHSRSVSNDVAPARPERTDKQHEMLKQTDAFKRMKNQTDLSRGQFEKLSLEKYDQIMGNIGPDDQCDGAEGGLEVNVNERRSHHRNNGNIDRIKAMQELGVPADEIIEIDRRISQQERDEELARLLQQQENKTLTFEEQDRLVAMEAQDKELARMLQERERAKAKRAKERARQRKLQQKQEESEGASSSHSRTHSELDGDSYSDPIDLIPNTDVSKSGQPNRNHPNAQQMGNAQQIQAHNMYYQDAVNLYDVNYSNPVDLVRSTSRSPTSAAGSKQSGNYRHDDDMYERPINNVEYNGPRRPNNLDIRHMNRPHQPTRPPKPSTIEHRDELGNNIATVIDPTYIESKGSPTTQNGSIPQNQPTNLPDFLDQSSSPVPPYMPIQGTRRNISLDNNKKKKAKDKCTHQ